MNTEEIVATVEAGYEKEALVKFSKENMNHQGINIVDEGHRFSYTYKQDIFYVDKILIWK